MRCGKTRKTGSGESTPTSRNPGGENTLLRSHREMFTALEQISMGGKKSDIRALRRVVNESLSYFRSALAVASSDIPGFPGFGALTVRAPSLAKHLI